jgi:hypothetical protein
MLSHGALPEAKEASRTRQPTAVRLINNSVLKLDPGSFPLDYATYAEQVQRAAVMELGKDLVATIVITQIADRQLQEEGAYLKGACV